MIKSKIVDNNPSFVTYSNYSIYHCLRGAFTPYFYEKGTLGSSRQIVLIQKVVPFYNSLIFFIVQILNRIFDRFVLVNTVSDWVFFTVKLYCYVFCIMNENLMAPRVPSNLSNKENKAYSIVQILKKNIMDESSLSESELDKYTKTKKSLFATLIKRKHTIKRPKVRITKKIQTCSTINIETGSASSEQEVTGFQMSAQNEKYFPPIKEVVQESPRNPKQKGCNIFKKILKRKPEHPELTLINSEDYNDLNREGDGDKCDYKILTHLNNFIPTSYLPKYNIKLINSMNELQNILQNLQYSEEHFTHLLKKYIEDQNFQEQLMQACYEYVSLQNSAKNQTNVLADGLWLQHQEMTKVHEHNLQKKLNFLVEANRTLQFQNENMCRHCEKLAARTNLYPKRFLHMRSFGKIYARHLIENNRKLQHKLKALTGVITDFEEEMQKLQDQKNELEEQRRKLKSQVYQLEGTIDRDRSDHELEKMTLLKQVSSQNRLIKDGEQASRYFLQELMTFERQAREMAILMKRTNFSYPNVSLPEFILHIRSYTGDLLVAILSAYSEVTSLAKDVTQLRYTNARLQENLHKSTNELDNLSKRLERSKETETTDLDVEARCNELKQEKFSLTLKLGTAEEQNRMQQEEINNTKKALNEANAKMSEFTEQNLKMHAQVAELAQLMSKLELNDLEKDNLDKFEYLRVCCVQVVTERKNLNERCANLDEENQVLLQNQELYQQDLTTLQEAVNILSAENDLVKKQLVTEHQTVISLQSERVKYLEEKNILKTIFQHLKTEIARVQQLEGTVVDMSKETNRLQLVAEFNKQLGEQLKSEVETKDNTILELRRSLEELTHIQIDIDKEKSTLSTQLCEASSAKDKLRNCLEIELKKNLHLDESKRKLETTTKSQMLIYEEMQRNERAALRELLKDYKIIIKQRDSLVYLCEENKKKQRDVDKHCEEWKKKYDSVVSQMCEKDKEMTKLMEKFEEKDVKLKEAEGKSQSTEAKYEKTMRKMEKLLAQFRSEKQELEQSNNYLKNNIQKIQTDLDEAREKEKEANNILTAKLAESSIVETELSECKNELQLLQQTNARFSKEMENINKMYEKKTEEFNAYMLKLTSKDSMIMESQHTMISKEQEISQLNKTIADLEHKISKMEQEHKHLKKQNEEQYQLMINYENQIALLSEVESTKFKLEKDLYNMQLEHKSTLSDLETSKKEIGRLNVELELQISQREREKNKYQEQTNELLSKYNHQKMGIEEEIDNISSQLQNVKDDLHKEQVCFDELSRAHEDLRKNFVQIKDKLSKEVKAHQETCRKLEDADSVLKSLDREKNDLQNQVRSMLIEFQEERDCNCQLSHEINNLHQVLTQGRKQYEFILSKNTCLEEEARKLRHQNEALSESKKEINKLQSLLEEKASELKAAKNNIEQLKKQLADSQKALLSLKEDYFNLQQKVTGLEFKNCELTLQIHESQAKLITERNLYKELKHLKVEDLDEATAMATSDCGDSYYKSEDNEEHFMGF